MFLNRASLGYHDPVYDPPAPDPRTQTDWNYVPTIPGVNARPSDAWLIALAAVAALYLLWDARK